VPPGNGFKPRQSGFQSFLGVIKARHTAIHVKKIRVTDSSYQRCVSARYEAHFIASTHAPVILRGKMSPRAEFNRFQVIFPFNPLTQPAHLGMFARTYSIENNLPHSVGSPDG
jgi:hypothetical protein